MRLLFLAAALSASAASAAAVELPADPLGSGVWDDIAARYFPGDTVVFDRRVRISVPASAEDQFQVPVTVDARGLADVVEIVVVADLNPIQRALSFRPTGAEPFVGFRLKVEQTTPVRAGVRTADGVWHVGGAVVEAAGGGCTAPAAAHGTANWMATLGQTRAMVTRHGSGTRLTMRMRHPMDTGLADGIPVFHLSRVGITGAGGALLGSLEIYEPVSEDPTFTFSFGPEGGTGFTVASRDTEGNEFGFAVDPATR